MDLGFNLAPSNRDLKDPTSRQNFGDTSGLLCKNDPILRPNHTVKMVLPYPCNSLIYIGWQLCSRKVGTLPGYQGTCTNQDMYQTNMNTRIR